MSQRSSSARKTQLAALTAHRQWESGDLWAARQSLYLKVPWVPRNYALPVTTGIFTLINVTAIIWLAAVNLYHVDYYTYWNFAIVTVWLLGITALYPIEGWPSALFTMFWTPITLGSTALVVIIILIVVAIDDRVYVSGTVADPAATINPDWTFSEIRTGDWIIHGLPLLEVLVVMLFDFQLYFRALIYHWERSDNWWRRWWYWLWFYLSPLLPLLIYIAIFDPRKKYTDELSLLAGVGIVVGVNLLVMTVYALSVRTSEPHGIVMPDFYPLYLHAPPVKPPQA